jgi:histidinol-phosphatase (PHP family)
MEETCRRAVQLGLPSIAFTEHADWVRGNAAVVDIAGYFDCLDRCRAAFPGLRILSGVELGEPHRYPGHVRQLLAYRPLDRVIGSVHCIDWDGAMTDASTPGFMQPDRVDEMYRAYLREVISMLESHQPFEVLAHLDYPKRYWPAGATYDESRFENELRSVLRAAAKRGVALELNTTRGGDPSRWLNPSSTVVRWWREEGGRALAFGSDAHSPEHLAAGFDLARQVAEAAGFRPQSQPDGFWLR